MSIPAPRPRGDLRPAGIERNGKLPWSSALLAAQKAQARRLEETEAEVIGLKVTVRTLQQRLHDARDRLENWKLRQEAWRRERAELIGKLRRYGLETGPPSPARQPEDW